MNRTTVKYLFRYTFVFIVISGMYSCGGGSDNDDPNPDPVPDPVAAILSIPANNEVCYDGTVVSAAMSEVDFSWQPAEHTDSYELTVTNLTTNSVKTYPTDNTQIKVSLDRGTPYSWYVVSTADNTTVEADSEHWKFYLAGEGITTYAPFPATLETPASGSTADPTEVIFKWKGSDADSESLIYELYLDTIDGKTEVVAEDMTENSFTISNLSPSTTYFWSVKTTDDTGNISLSMVYSFKTN